MIVSLRPTQSKHVLKKLNKETFLCILLSYLLSEYHIIFVYSVYVCLCVEYFDPK